MFLAICAINAPEATLLGYMKRTTPHDSNTITLNSVNTFWRFRKSYSAMWIGRKLNRNDIDLLWACAGLRVRGKVISRPMVCLEYNLNDNLAKRVLPRLLSKGLLVVVSAKPLRYDITVMGMDMLEEYIGRYRELGIKYDLD